MFIDQPAEGVRCDFVTPEQSLFDTGAVDKRFVVVFAVELWEYFLDGFE